MTLHTYISQDRLRALARGESLPNRTSGSALFADISGFTALTEALHESLGSRRGVEEISKHLDAVYTTLIAEVEKYGGNVIGFAGDAITCWFDEEKDEGSRVKDEERQSVSSRAVACAFALQIAMRTFNAITLPDGTNATLSLKVAVASGAARRFVVGDPNIQRLDTLAGATIARTSTAEHLAHKGEVLLDEATVNALGKTLTISEWRSGEEDNERFAVAESYTGTILPEPQLITPSLSNEQLKTWIHHTQYEREASSQGMFLTEFRPCVALFVRFVGIDYDADEAESQLDTFIQQAQTIVARHDGTLLSNNIGDKGSYLYISLGALSAHEDDVRRAVKIALELFEDAQAMTFLTSLQMGITQGIMRVGAYGGQTRRAYSALGDETNLAARLMQTAAPNEILISGRAQKAVAHEFVFEPRPALILKGKSQPLTAFVVLGESQQRAIRLQEPVYALPMVGREQELGIINDKLELTLSAKGQVIGIVAEAGMGKSRLVAEVIRLAKGKGFIGYGGACQSDGVNTPYLAWKSIWSAFFGIDHELPIRKQTRLLEIEIKKRTPKRVDALPLLGILLDIAIPESDFTQTLEPKYRQSALRALLEDCLRVSAIRESPLLIVIEDVHWIDALSHDLLEELARALADSPVCFVLAYRPQSASVAHLETSRIEALPNFTKIELHELNQAEAEQAIRAKLAQLYPHGSAIGSALPIGLVDKLMARSQGNPFYLEELLNFLHDRGLDSREPNALEKIELPNSLHALILSRIDQLNEREKTTLRVASIVGRLFRAHWLTGYYPELGQLPEVKTDLEQLSKIDITPLDTPEPELAYLFKHIVTHEVTYESLPFATRAHLHEQLAAYLEKQITVGALREASLLDTLVFHYAHSDNHDKQRYYLRKAGQAALDVSAFNTAAEYLSQLVELTPVTDPTYAALALQLAEAHFRLSNYPAAHIAIQQAQASAITDIDRAATLAFLGEMTSGLGDYNAAQTILAEAVPLARMSGNSLTLCRALYALGDVNWRLGKLPDAKIALDESLELARTLGDVTRELFALTRLGSVIGQQGNLDEKERLLHEVHARAVAVGNRERAMLALNNLGVVAGERHDFAAARDNFQQALTLAREIGAQDAIARGLSNLANENLNLGQLDAVREGLREALALALRLGALPWAVGTVRNFAQLLQAEGKTEQALELYGLTRIQPAWNSDLQRMLDIVFDDWGLDPAVIEAGMARGAALDWDATIQELLKL